MSSDTDTSTPTPTPTASPRNGATADKASRFLSNLNRFTTAAAPAPPLVRDEPAEAPAEPAPAPRAARPTRRRLVADADRIDRSFEVAAGRGVRVLTARIPRDLHARVYLVATNNRFAERDAPRTINELVMDALHEWLDKHDAA